MTEELKSAQDLADSLISHEVMASEEMNELYSRFSVEEAEDAIMNTTETMLSNAQDPERMQRIVMLEFQFAQSMESERMAEHAQNAMQKIEDKYGPEAQ